MENIDAKVINKADGSIIFLLLIEYLKVKYDIMNTKKLFILMYLFTIAKIHINEKNDVNICITPFSLKNGTFNNKKNIIAP